MFCFQCQETAKNAGCTVKGVCGKNEGLANLQDLLIYTLGRPFYCKGAFCHYHKRKLERGVVF